MCSRYHKWLGKESGKCARVGISQNGSALDFLWIQRYGMGTIAIGWCFRFAAPKEALVALYAGFGFTAFHNVSALTVRAEHRGQHHLDLLHERTPVWHTGLPKCKSITLALLVYTSKRSAPYQSDTSGRYYLPRSWHSHPRALRPGSAPKSVGTVGTWTRYGDNRSPTSCCPRQ